jgi:lysozyme
MDRQKLVDQIIQHEGIKLKPYTDTVGKLTIGVGRNLTDVGLSDREAMILLDHDLDDCLHDLTQAFPWFGALDDVRQRAVVDLRFNLGAAGLQGFRNFLHCMAVADYAGAARELLNSKAATQAPFRYRELADHIRTGTD